jgi:hypothetical protein
MKKITLLIVLMITSLGFSQDPATGPANPPARNAVDVKSIYNGIATPVAPEYTNEPNGTFDSFGGSTIVGDVVLGDMNTVIKYTNHLYSGIRAGAGDLDVSTMEKLHIDVYSPGFTVFKIKLEAVNGSNVELEVTGTKVQGAWNSFDIDLSAYAAVDLVHLKWIVPVTYTPPGETLYIDNVYFWKTPTAAGSDATLSDLKVDGSTISGFSAGVINYTISLPNGTTVIPQITTATTTDGAATKVITQATALPGSATVVVTSQNTLVTKTYTVNYILSGPSVKAPTPPARPIADVISLFSDAYTNIGVSEWSTGWDEASVTDIMVEGNATKKITYGNFLGVQLADYNDATAMTHFHMDYYIDNTVDLVGKVLNPKLSNHAAMSGETNALLLTNLPTVKGAWVPLDVELSAFAAQGAGTAYAREKIYQFLLQSNIGTVYVDNIYLHKNTVLGTSKFETSKVKMYPNPVKNTLTIEANSEIQRVSVFNILGQEVMKASPKSNTATLQTNELQKGVYMVTTEIDGKVSTSKVVKE